MWLLGNVLSLIGCSLMVCIGFIRRKERVLACQCVQFGFLAAGNLILGAYSGGISGIVSILRNLVFTRRGGGTLLKLGFIAVQILLTLLAGWAGAISLLPLTAGILFTWFIDTRSDARLKLVIVATLVLWGIYDLHYQNYVAFTFDILTIGTNGFSLIALLRKK